MRGQEGNVATMTLRSDISIIDDECLPVVGEVRDNHSGIGRMKDGMEATIYEDSSLAAIK